MCKYVATQKSNLTTHMAGVHSTGTFKCKVKYLFFLFFKCHFSYKILLIDFVDMILLSSLISNFKSMVLKICYT